MPPVQYHPTLDIEKRLRAFEQLRPGEDPSIYACIRNLAMDLEISPPHQTTAPMFYLKARAALQRGLADRFQGNSPALEAFLDDFMPTFVRTVCPADSSDHVFAERALSYHERMYGLKK